MRAKRTGLIVVLSVILVACGGAGLDDVVDGEDVFGTSQPTTDDGGSDSGGGEVGPVTVTADPSTAWVEVGGARIEYESINSIGYACTITEQMVSINFQTPEGHDLVVRGSPIDGEWFLNITFVSRDEENVSYSASMLDGGALGLGDNQLSYEGGIDRVVDRDILNPEELDGQLAVNCNLPSGQPTANIDGTEYVLGFVGAGSVQCDISTENIDIQINRLTVDDTNLQITAKADGDGWSGIVAVGTPEGTFVQTESPALTGLAVTGSSVTYSGMFSSDGVEVDGTVEVTCP